MFAFSEEQEELRRTVRKFVEHKATEPVVRALMATVKGYDEDTWTQMSEQLGLQGLIVPEAQGGAGLGPVEMIVVMEEMGRALFCAPYLSTAVLAVSTLVHAADESARGELLSAIAGDGRLVTLAFVEESGNWDLSSIAMRATEETEGDWRLDGEKTYVLDGHVADVLLVAARIEEGLSLFRVDAGASGVSRALLPTLDLTRKLARVSFKNTPATRITMRDSQAGLEKALAVTCAALAAEQAGGAQRCLEMATEYARTRLQFGRPIGSFQAIKHRCADMLVEVELCKSAAYNAGFCATSADASDALAAANLAKAYCSEAYLHAAAETIQIHGGIGFTWEHPIHLYFKRASSAVLFGDAVYHRERLAQRIGI